MPGITNGDSEFLANAGRWMVEIFLQLSNGRGPGHTAKRRRQSGYSNFEDLCS